MLEVLIKVRYQSQNLIYTLVREKRSTQVSQQIAQPVHNILSVLPTVIRTRSYSLFS